jgi:hypothetical protein
MPLLARSSVGRTGERTSEAGAKPRREERVTHPFMSNAWFDAIIEIRDEVGEIPVDQATRDVVINLVVTDGPDGDQEMHVKPGSFGRGLAENAPTKLTMPYEIARNLFVERDQQIAVEAFMAGRIRIEGEIGPLMRLRQPRDDTPQSRELKDRIREITEV